MHAVIGPNGAGKSTCFNVLSGVYRATSGSVRFGEHELTGMRPHRIAGLGRGPHLPARPAFEDEPAGRRAERDIREGARII
ncbi:hypothetical protein SALBM135S_10104 [Streptomyces alboniger]